MARIERAGPRARPSISAGRRGLVSAVAVGAMLGVRDVFEPPEPQRLEIPDPWSREVTSARVRFHWHRVPWRSVAEVRW
jgi:hypothetical protein